MKNINNFYKIAGLGVLNAVLPVEEQPETPEQTFEKISEILPTQYNQVLNSYTIEEFSTQTGVTVNSTPVISGLGYKISGDNTELLSGTAAVLVDTTGSSENLSSLNAKLIPDPEIENNCLGIVQSRVSGDSEFIFSVTGTNLQGVRKLSVNNDIELSLLNSGQFIYKNKNSNTIPGVFEMSFIRPSEIFNPADFTSQELAEIASQAGVDNNTLNEWIQVSESAPRPRPHNNN
jgi:hypothetical protein